MMNRSLKIIFFIVLIFFFSLMKIVPLNSAQKIFANISAQEFNKLMYMTRQNIILDVRQAIEFKQGHIKGAVLIDFYALDYKKRLNRLDKNKRYFIYCRSGRRSAIVLQVMKDFGFKYVYNMRGGINAWTANGLPLEE